MADGWNGSNVAAVDKTLYPVRLLTVSMLDLALTIPISPSQMEASSGTFIVLKHSQNVRVRYVGKTAVLKDHLKDAKVSKHILII